MNKLNTEQAKEALENHLKSINIDKFNYVHHSMVNNRIKFCLVSKNADGKIINTSNFMTYEEFNTYLFGVGAILKAQIISN